VGIFHILPWFGLELLDTARDVAEFDLPVRVIRMFGARRNRCKTRQWGGTPRGRMTASQEAPCHHCHRKRMFRAKQQ
jgi:hypothetical protein